MRQQVGEAENLGTENSVDMSHPDLHPGATKASTNEFPEPQSIDLENKTTHVSSSARILSLQFS